MFYSQDILQKRGGKFSKIWLAATKMCKLNRREVASVHVARSCDEILEYVEVRVAPGPTGKRPRFSLYLSALLMYGVVRVHQKQSEYLLEDVSTALVRLQKTLGKIGAVDDIDLQTENREDLVTNPEFEVNEENFQEIMEFHFLSDEELTILLGRPDPVVHCSYLLEFWRYETTLSPRLPIGSPERPLVPPMVPSPQREQFQPVVDLPHQVSRDEITLQEPPPSVLSDQIPQLDLPRLDGTEIDMNLAALDQAPLTVQDLLPPTSTPAEQPRERRRSTRRRQEKDQQTEVPAVPEPVQEQTTPDRRPSEKLPETRAVPQSPGVTLPVITSPLPRRQQINLDPLELVQESRSPAKRRKRRQLGFADAETQIPKNVMKVNLAKTDDITATFVLPSAKPTSVTDILNLPSGRPVNHPQLLPLWKRNARTRRNVAEAETPEASSPSDVQSERAAPAQGQPKSPEFIAIPLPRLEQAQLSPVVPQPDISGVERSVIYASVQALRQASITRTAVIEDIEMSAVEQARDISTSTIEQGDQISLEESLIQDSAKKDSTKKRRKTRSARTSLVVEPDQTGPTPSVSLSQTRTLFDVQEEPEVRVPEVLQPLERPEVEIPAPILEEVTVDPAQARQTLLREVRDELRGGLVETTFRRLCPPALTDRKTAAVKFSALLDLCRDRKLTAHQSEAYGDIMVSLAGKKA